MASQEPNFDELDKMLEEGPDLGDGGDPLAGDGPTEMVVQQPSDALKESVSAENIAKDLKDSFLDFLPNNTGTAIRDALYVGDDIIEEGSKIVDNIRHTGADLLSGLGNILPESVGSVFSRLGEWIRPETFDSTGNTELSEDEKIKQEIAGLFGEEISKEAKMQEMVAKAEALASKSQEELLAKLVTTSEENVGLKLTYDLKYQRRDLELSIKRTLTLTKLYALMEKYTKLSSTQFEAIVKNTALPDFAKQTSFEMLKHTLMKNAIEGSSSLFLRSDMAKNIKSNVLNMVNNKLQTVAEGLGMGRDVISSMQDMSEFATPAAMMTTMIADMARKKATDAIMEPFIQGLLKSDKTQDTYKMLEELRNDPSKAIAKIKDNISEDEWHSGASKKVLSILEELTKTSDTTNVQNVIDTSKLDKPSFFDERTKFSIVNVIPTLLSKILQEVRTIRKGKKEVSEADLEYFDFKQNRFTNKKAAKKEVMKTIKTASKRVSDTFETRILPMLVGDVKSSGLSKKDILYLYDKFNQYLLDGGSLSPFAIAEEFPKYIKDKTKLYKLVNIELGKYTNKEAVKEGKHIELRDAIENYKYNAFDNYNNVLKKIQDTNSYEILSELGLMSKDDLTSINTNTVEKFNIKYGRRHLATALNKKQRTGEEERVITTSNQVESDVTNATPQTTNTTRPTAPGQTTTNTSNVNNITNNAPANTNTVNNTITPNIERNVRTTTLNRSLTTPIRNITSNISPINNTQQIAQNNIRNITTPTTSTINTINTRLNRAQNNLNIPIVNTPINNNNANNNVVNTESTPTETETTNVTNTNTNVKSTSRHNIFSNIKTLISHLPQTVNNRIFTNKVNKEDHTEKEETTNVNNTNVNNSLYTLPTHNIQSYNYTSPANAVSYSHANIYNPSSLAFDYNVLPTTVNKLHTAQITELNPISDIKANMEIKPIPEPVKVEVPEIMDFKVTVEDLLKELNKNITKINTNEKTTQTTQVENINIAQATKKWFEKLTNKNFNQVLNSFKNMPKTLIKDLRNILTTKDKKTKSYFDRLIEAIKNISKNINVKIDTSELVSNLENFTKNINDKFTSLLSSSTAKNITEFKNKITNTVIDKASSGIKTIKDNINKNSIKEYTKNKYETIKNFAESKIEDMKNLDSEKIANAINSVIDSMADNIASIKQSMQSRFKDLNESLPKFVTELKDSVTSIFSSVSENIKSKLPEISPEVTKTFTELKTTFSNVISDVNKNVASFYKDFKESLSTENQARLKYLEDKVQASNKFIVETYDKAKNYLDNPELIKEEFSKNTTKIKEEYTKAKDKIINYIRDPETLKKEAKELKDNLKKDLKEKAKGTKAESAVNKAIEVFEKLENNMPTSKKELEEALETAKNNIPKNKTELIDAINKAEKTLKEKALGLTNKLENGIKDLDKEKITETASNIVDKINALGNKVGIENTISENSKNNLKQGIDTTVNKVESMSKNLFNKARESLTRVNDVDADFLQNSKSIEQMIENHGFLKILKKEMLNVDLPKTVQEAETVYKALFTILDPTGKTWDNLYKRDPKLLDKLRDIHMEAIEEARKGLIEKGLDLTSDSIEGGVNFISKTRDKFLNLLPKPIRNKIEPLLKNRFTDLTGDLTKRISRAGNAAGKLLLNETKLIGKEGLELFYDPRTGTIHLPRLTDIARFSKHALTGHTKALSKALKIFYPELFGGAAKVAKTAIKTAWDFTGIGRAMTRNKALAKARFNPPIDRRLYNAWLKGELTGKQILELLETEEDKERWENFLTIVKPKGITLPDMLLKTGKGLINLTKLESKGIKKFYPKLGKLLFTGSKIFTKQAWNLTGIGDVVKAKATLLKAKINPPIKDRMLYQAWLSGELTGNQVEAALSNDNEKEAWNNFLLKVSPKGLKLSDTLNNTGKNILDMLEESSEKTALGNPILKALKTIIKAPLNLAKGIGKFGLNTIKGIGSFGKGTAKFIADIADKKILSKPPIYYLPDELTEPAGDFIAEVLPDEINGVPKNEILDMFFEKIKSRKINRLVKKHMEKLIYLLPKIDKKKYFEEARDNVLEVAGLIVDYNTKRKEEKQQKEDKKRKELEELYAMAGMKPPTEENMKQDKEEAEKLKNSVVKELGKEPTKYIDLLFRWDLREQLEFLANRAVKKGFDASIFKTLEKEVDYENGDLINSLRRFSELFASYKKNKLKTIEPLKEEADNIIINLLELKSFTLPTATDILTSVIGKVTNLDIKPNNKESSNDVINELVNNNTTEDKEKQETKETKQTKAEPTKPSSPETKLTETKQVESAVLQTPKQEKIPEKITKFSLPQVSITPESTKTKTKNIEEKLIEKTNEESLQVEKQELSKLETIETSTHKTTDAMEKLLKIEEDKLEEEKKKEKIAKKKQLNAYMDNDKDGDRDGNWKDRLAKLYGKTKHKAKDVKEIIKEHSDKDSILSKLLAFAPFMAGAIFELFKHPLGLITKGITWLGKHLLKGLWSVSKWLVKGLGHLLLQGLSHIPFLKNLVKPIGETAKKVFDKTKSLFHKTKPENLETATHKVEDKIKDKITDHVTKDATKEASKSLIGKIISKLKVMKGLILKKFSKKVAGELLAKIAARFIPFVGEALLASDAISVGYYMLHDHLPLDSAISKAILGIDIFGNDKDDKTANVPTDINGKPIKPELSAKAKEEAEKKADQWVKNEHPDKEDNKHEKALPKAKVKKHDKIFKETEKDNKVEDVETKPLIDELKPEETNEKEPEIKLPKVIETSKLSPNEITELYSLIYRDKKHIYFKDGDDKIWQLPFPKPGIKLNNEYPLDARLFFEALQHGLTSKNKTYKEFTKNLLTKPKLTNKYQEYTYVTENEQKQLEFLQDYVYLKEHHLVNDTKINFTDLRNKIKPVKKPKPTKHKETYRVNKEPEHTNLTNNVSRTNNLQHTNQNEINHTRDITTYNNHRANITNQQPIIKPDVKVHINNPNNRDISDISNTTKEAVNIQRSMDSKLSELVNLNKKLVSHLVNNNAVNKTPEEQTSTEQPKHTHKPSSHKGSTNTPKGPVALKTKIF